MSNPNQNELSARSKLHVEVMHLGEAQRRRRRELVSLLATMGRGDWYRKLGYESPLDYVQKTCGVTAKEAMTLLVAASKLQPPPRHGNRRGHGGGRGGRRSKR